MATFVPNARQQFCDSNGTPLALGTVGMYVIGTTTPSNTWQDAAQTTLNANPITLDAGGYATIYGSGDYRQIVKDALGNVVWDRVVTVSQTLNYPATGQFYAELGSSIQRVRDRLFIGDAADNLGTNVSSQPDWLTTFVMTQGRTYGHNQISQAAVLTQNSPAACNGLLGGARTSTFTAIANAIGIEGVAVNNNSTYSCGAYAGYNEAYQMTGALGPCYAHEFDIINRSGATGTSDPFQQAVTQTVGIQVASGGEYASGLTSASAALQIRKNGADFLSGIVFGSDAIKQTGGIGEAIAFGKGHKMQWYGAAATPTSSIFSDGTTSANATSLQFGEGFVQILNPAGKPIVKWSSTSSGVNYVSLANGITGNAASLSAAGDDTNIDLALTPKGTGNLKFGSFTSNADAPVTGYITIKDSGGTVRKLATIA